MGRGGRDEAPSRKGGGRGRGMQRSMQWDGASLAITLSPVS